MNILQNLTAAQLRNLASIKDQIEALQAELEGIADGDGPKDVATSHRRGMSVAGRARIAAAQKARWAKVRGDRNEAKPAGRRKMSPAWRAKIAAAARARWAKAKAAGRTAL